MELGRDLFVRTNEISITTKITTENRYLRFLEYLNYGKLTPIEIDVPGGWSPIPNTSNISEDDKQWLAGFIEGDGSIFNKSKYSSICLNQKDSRVLYFIQDLVGAGTLYSNGYNKAGNLMVSISFNGIEKCLPIIKILADYLVCPHTQKSILSQGYELEIHKPTIPWICGFWDAEGHFGLNKNISIIGEIVQNDITVLESIQKIIGGRLHRKHKQLWLRKLELLEFSKYFLRYSHNPAKYEQLISTLEKYQKLQDKGGLNARPL